MTISYHRSRALLRRGGILAGLIAAAWSCLAAGAGASSPEWSGHGSLRILVEVGPAPECRSGDQTIAACTLDLEDLLKKASLDQGADIGTFQVHQFDARTGKPTPSHAPYGSTPYDLPCRYEDAAIAEQYESRVGRASESIDGRPPAVSRLRKSRLFNREMNNCRGRLVWSHAASPTGASHYAIYFEGAASEAPPKIPAAPWLGDADVLRAATGQPLGGWSHFTTAVGDLNGDNLFDIVAGTEKGDLVWSINRGTAEMPKFLGCQLLKDQLGPIDVGWYAAPFLVDWDKDGDLDLLVGTSGNVILWWRNVGDSSSPAFRYKGFIEADGKRLEVPEQPVAEDPNGIFARDYFNQPWAGDFDGDGTIDLVTGGYTTGQIFWYRGNRPKPDGTAQLTFAGPVIAEGQAIDVIWAAAPTCFDMDGDNRIDLLTGAWRWSGIPGPAKPGEEDLLQCYLGVDGPTDDSVPQFTKVQFPAKGIFPAGSIARPSVIDANGDRLLDLFVSESGGNAYLFYNVGTRESPKWDVASPPLTVAWGFVRGYDVAASMADLTGDGSEEYISGNVIYSLQGPPFAPRNERVGVAHVAGRPIHHPGPGYGDPYSYAVLCRFDDDDRADVLWGTQQGNLYWHRNLGAVDELAFDEGKLISLTTGDPLRLGPPVVESADEADDFTILQGSRIVFTYDDFDGDGVRDIIAGETYGNLWIFRGSPQSAERAFEPGVVLTKLATRPEAIACTDWDGDGRLDVLIGGTASDPITILTNTSAPGQPAITPAKSLQGLPYLFWGPKVRATDWNGDGDVDLLVQSEFFSFWVERSFLDHGYHFATVSSKLESRSHAVR